MRTTLRLDDDLLAEVKQAAARTGTTLAEFIEDAIRESLSRRRASGWDSVEPAAVSRLPLGLRLDTPRQRDYFRVK